MLTLAAFTKLLKSSSSVKNISDEEFINALLHPYVIAGDIENKNGEEFRLDKTRTSQIINHKSDVPGALRQVLNYVGIREATVGGMNNFIEEFIGKSRKLKLNEALAQIIKSEDTITETERDLLLKEELSECITDLLMTAISNSNLIDASENIIWKNGKNSVTVILGDLFHFGFENRKKQKNIVVVPVNNTFDTHVTRKLEEDPFPIVSENTIHGQWLLRMQQSGESEQMIYDRIISSLSKMQFSPIRYDGDGKECRKIYPIGSIAIIESNNAYYFLLAVSEFDKNNVAHSNYNDIDKAIITLLEKYNSIGQGYDMYVPLIGTGRSRAGLSNKGSFQLLKKS